MQAQGWPSPQRPLQCWWSCALAKFRSVAPYLWGATLKHRFWHRRRTNLVQTSPLQSVCRVQSWDILPRRLQYHSKCRTAPPRVVPAWLPYSNFYNQLLGGLGVILEFHLSVGRWQNRQPKWPIMGWLELQLKFSGLQKAPALRSVNREGRGRSAFKLLSHCISAAGKRNEHMAGTGGSPHGD